MDARNFLKPKKFNIKAKNIRFESAKYLTDLEKKKIYINFVKFLNNHFSQSTFKKNLYEHFHLHCGFIAHYNIHGFYGEYFETAAKFHYNVNGVNHKIHECGGNLNCKSSYPQGELFYAIYEEMNGGRDGLGAFIDTLLNNRNYGGYAEYRDLDEAIKDAFNTYLEIWREEIKKAVKAYNEFSKDKKVKKLKENEEAIKKEQMRLNESLRDVKHTLEEEAMKAQSKRVEKTQTSLFDFLESA